MELGLSKLGKAWIGKGQDGWCDGMVHVCIA